MSAIGVSWRRALWSPTAEDTRRRRRREGAAGEEDAKKGHQTSQFEVILDSPIEKLRVDRDASGPDLCKGWSMLRRHQPCAS